MRIVVGVDFGDSGVRAVREGLRLAKAIPACELHLVTVVDPSDVDHNDLAALDNLLEETRQRLDVHAATIASQVDPEGHGWEQRLIDHVRFGDDPGEALCQVAADVEATLLIVGTRPRPKVERVILGSVAESLVASAPVPVLVARDLTIDAWAKTPKPDPGTPGLDLKKKRLAWSENRVTFGRRNTHISGLV